MLRKIFTAAAFVLVLACGSVSAADAQEEAVAAAMAAMAKEPPLVQADIDVYIELTAKIIAAGGSQEAVAQLYEESGVAPERLGFIGAKVSMGTMLARGMSREDLLASGRVPEFLLPNEEEAALIEQNLPAIMKAMGAPGR